MTNKTSPECLPSIDASPRASTAAACHGRSTRETRACPGRSIAICAIAALLLGCGGGGGNSGSGSGGGGTTNVSATGTVGPTGGTVAITSRAMVEVGPGALQAPAEVSITLAPRTDSDTVAANDVVVTIPADKLSASPDASITVHLFPDAPAASSMSAERAKATALGATLDVSKYVARAKLGASNVVQWDLALGQKISTGTYTIELNAYQLLKATSIQAGRRANQGSQAIGDWVLTFAFNVHARNFVNVASLHRWPTAPANGQLAATPEDQPALANASIAPDKVPLVLVHGIDAGVNACGTNTQFADTWKSFATNFGKYPELNARYEVFTFRYATNNSIKDNGRRLAEEIARVLGNRPAVVVAHSMGGLVTRSADLYFTVSSPFRDPRAVDIDLRRVITLDTPHRGTPVAGSLAMWREEACIGSATDQGAIDLDWQWAADGTTCNNALLCDLNRADHSDHLRKYIPYAGTFAVVDTSLRDAVLAGTTPLVSAVQTLRSSASCVRHPVYCLPRYLQQISAGDRGNQGDGVTLVTSEHLLEPTANGWATVPNRFLSVHPVFDDVDHSSIHDLDAPNTPSVFRDWIKPDLLDFYTTIQVATQSAPTISTQPADAAVISGQTATFTIAATGTGLIYDWRKGTAQSNIAPPGATNSPAYTTPPTTLSDDGSTYFVVVAGTGGTATSTPARLSVSAAPTGPSIGTNPASQSMVVGASATFTVVATGTNPTYQWRLGTPQASVPAPGTANAPSYTTPPTTLADNGASYFVIVSNTAGSVSSATATLTVLPSITAGATQLAMTATPDPVRPGQFVQYTTTLTNRTTGDAIYRVVVTIPAFTTVSGSTIGQSGGCNGVVVLNTVCTSGQTVQWNNVVVAAGQSATLTFAGQVTASNPPTNGTVISATATASVSSGTVTGATGSVDVVVSTTDAALTMAAGPSPVAAGGTIAYALQFTNPSATSIASAVLNVPLPPGTRVASISDGGVLGAGVVSWNIGALAPGASGTRRIVVSVDPAISAGAIVTARADLRDTTSARSLARATAIAEVLGATITQLALSATPDPVRPGEFVHYTIKVANRGSTDSVYRVDALLPEGTTATGGTIGQGGGCSGIVVLNTVCSGGQTIVWASVPVRAGQSVTLSYAAQVNATSPPPEGTVIRSTATAMPAAGGNAALAAVDAVVSSNDLSMGMTTDPGVITPGGTLRYTVRFGNPRTAPIASSSLVFVAPPGTRLLSVSDGGTSSGDVAVWNIGPLQAGAFGAREVTLAVDAQIGVGSIVAAAEIRDAAAARSLARATATTDVPTTTTTQIAIAASHEVARPGQPIQYAITLANRGATDVVYRVDALLPQFTRATGGSVGQSGGCAGIVVLNTACASGGTIQWNTVRVPAGRTVSFSFGAIVDATGVPDGRLTRATVTATPSQATAGGASATSDVALSTSNLVLGTSSTASRVAPGETLTYTLRYGNPTTTSTAPLTLVASLPPGMSVLSASDGGVAGANGVTWAIGPIASGATGSRQLVVMVNAAASPASLFAVTSDLRDANSLSSVAHATSLAEAATSAGTLLAAAAGPDPVRGGQALQFSITLTNASAADATYRVDALMPSYAKASGYTIQQGGGCFGIAVQNVVCGGGDTVVWGAVSVPAGQSVLLTYSATLNLVTNQAPVGMLERTTVTATPTVGSPGGSMTVVDAAVQP